MFKDFEEEWVVAMQLFARNNEKLLPLGYLWYYGRRYCTDPNQ